jgi:hypothetical protein
MTRGVLLVSFGLGLASPVLSQGPRPLAEAEAAYGNLDFARTIALASRATRERLPARDLERAWELLGFAYASLDSSRQARDAFKQVAFLNPDWTLDEERISPKITSLHALALREVLLVRHPVIDSADFVLGAGSVGIRFTVTRTARVQLRLLGPGGSTTLDTLRGDGQMLARWDGRLAGGATPGGGVYTLVIEVAAGRDTYARSLRIQVTPGTVDTVPHLAALPGYDLLPEAVVPPRSWRPLGIALITSALTGGAALALESGPLGGGPRRELAGVSVASLGVGLLSMLRKPAPVPSEANIRYNRIVRDNLARENARIAQENETRRRQVRLAVAPLRAEPSPGGQP